MINGALAVDRKQRRITYQAAVDNRTNCNVRNDAMAILRERIPRLKRPGGWDWIIWPSSAGVYDKRRNITLKVMADSKVFIDRKMPSGGFKSQQVQCDSVPAACDYVQDYITKNYLEK